MKISFRTLGTAFAAGALGGLLAIATPASQAQPQQAPQAAPAPSTRTVDVNGTPRHYLLDLPANYDPARHKALSTNSRANRPGVGRTTQRKPPTMMSPSPARWSLTSAPITTSIPTASMPRDCPTVAVQHSTWLATHRILSTASPARPAPTTTRRSPIVSNTRPCQLC